MTQETLKRLLEHYRAIGYKEAEEDLLRKYPNIEVKSVTTKSSNESKK